MRKDLDLDHIITTGQNARKSVRDTFIAKIASDPDDCWHWTGPKFSNGYGSFKSCGGDYLAHRVAFEVFFGRKPVGILMHTCDNRLCVNPSHLVEGTTAENIKDMLDKGRGNSPRGMKVPRCALSDDDVLEIKARRLSGEQCKSIALDYPVSAVHISRITCGTRRNNSNENKNMTPQEYVQKAMRTKNNLGYEHDVVHAAMLLTAESGEVMSEVKRMFVYGKKLDTINIKEELGDIMWGIALMCDTLGFDLEDVMRTNIAKLEARYPEKCFSADRALNRDIAAEQAAMKG